MANTYAKKQSDHPSDYNVNNNGGVLVGILKGGTPAQQVGTTNTEMPINNRPVKESEL